MLALDTYCFDSAGRFQIKQQAETGQLDEANATFRRQKYCCAVCGYVITTQGDAVEVDGAHQHARINPDGRRFLLRCFSIAAGCGYHGDATSYHTWFTGYAWRYAHCSRCQSQLGWYFQGNGSFYGLISEQLVHCDDC